MEDNNNSKLPDIDINGSEFYETVQNEIEFDVARLKKTVELVKNLRLTAAEMEVETAALYHADLFKNIEELKCITDLCNESLNNLQEETQENDEDELDLQLIPDSNNK